MKNTREIYYILNSRVIFIKSLYAIVLNLFVPKFPNWLSNIPELVVLLHLKLAPSGAFLVQFC